MNAVESYELALEINEKDQLLFDNIYDRWLDAATEAEQFVAQLVKEMDLGSWTVAILTHWCDLDGWCGCAEQREDDKPYAAFRGMTIPINLLTEGG